MKTSVRTKLGVFVELDPDDAILWKKGATQYEINRVTRERAGDILPAIKAVAELGTSRQFYRDTYIVETFEDRCSHCNGKWETESSGQPCCCAKAIEEWDAAKVST